MALKCTKVTIEDIPSPLDDTNESREENNFREEYFLSDPASWWDALPQPYLMIDQTVEYVLERVWASIEQRQRMRKSQKISSTGPTTCATPTAYGARGVLTQLSNVSCTGFCDDLPYIVLGTMSGMYVMDGLSQTVCAYWQGPNTEITDIHLYKTPQNSFLITTIDDLGDARIFVFIEPDLLTLVHTINEKEESDTKPLIAACAISANAEYLAVSIDTTPSRKRKFIAVYSLPSENWESLLRATDSRQETSPVSEDVQSTTPLSHVKEAISPHFQEPTLILKIQAIEIMPGQTGKNLQYLCKSVDVTGEVIGTGLNNIISQSHLDLRKAALEYLHEDLKKCKQELEPTVRHLNFQFIDLPDGHHHASSPAILVWSFDSHILSLFFLAKTRKELTVSEPDRVWPFAAVITVVAVSRFSTMLAVGLENGCVIVWDMYFGIMRGVVYLGVPSPVRQLHFLYSPDHQVSDQTSHFACDLIATLKNGMTKRLTSSASNPLTAITILPGTDDILVTQLIPISAKNELVLISFSNGVVLLLDVFEGDTLCELQLMPGYKLDSSWAPMLSVVTGNGLSSEQIKSYAYIIGSSEMTSRCCFYFSLTEFSVLKSYWTSFSKPYPFVKPVSLEHQQNIFLNKRIKEQKERNARLRVRWKEFIQYMPNVNKTEVDSGS